MRIAFAGAGRFGAMILSALIASSHEVVAFMGDGRKTRGWRRRLYPPLAALFASSASTLRMARRRGIPIIYLDKMTENELSLLRETKPDLLFVSGFGIILKSAILSIPRIGCVNCHSSLLPRHRGPNPFSAVIAQGEEMTGVTFHVMTEGVDDGDILAQFPILLNPDDTAFDVYNRASELARTNVVSIMDIIETQGLQGVPQNPDLATYDKKLMPEELQVDWRRSAIEIERYVRAYGTVSPMRFPHRGRMVYLLSCRADPKPVDALPGIVTRSGRDFAIATGEGTIILKAAAVRWPMPWLWPGVFNRPRQGESLI